MSAKVDPETLVIRAAPARAIRFKRGVIVGIAAVGVGRAGRRHLDRAEAARLPGHRSTSDEQVGPGREGACRCAECLAQELWRRPAARATAARRPRASRSSNEQQQMLADGSMRRHRFRTARPKPNRRLRPSASALLAEVKAARQSALLVQSGGRTEAAATAGTASIEAPVAAGDAGKVALDPERDPNGQQRKSDFVARSTKDG